MTRNTIQYTKTEWDAPQRGTSQIEMKIKSNRKKSTTIVSAIRNSTSVARSTMQTFREIVNDGKYILQ